MLIEGKRQVASKALHSYCSNWVAMETARSEVVRPFYSGSHHQHCLLNDRISARHPISLIPRMSLCLSAAALISLNCLLSVQIHTFNYFRVLKMKELSFKFVHIATQSHTTRACRREKDNKNKCFENVLVVIMKMCLQSIWTVWCFLPLFTFHFQLHRCLLNRQSEFH